MQTGVQVLFAFLLTAPLAARFPQELSAFQRLAYFVTLLAAGAAAILLIAPTAYHRILFRLGDKEHLVAVANRFTLAGLACVAVSITGALLLVTDVIFAGTIVVIATTALAAVTCVLPGASRRCDAGPSCAAADEPCCGAGPGVRRATSPRTEPLTPRCPGQRAAPPASKPKAIDCWPASGTRTRAATSSPADGTRSAPHESHGRVR